MMKRKYLFPTLVIAGVAGYYFMTRKTAAATVPTNTIAPGEPDYTSIPDYGDSNYITQPTPVKTYTPSTPVSQIITTNDPVKKQYLQSLATQIPKDSTWWPALNLMSSQGLQYLYSLASYIPPTNTSYWSAFIKMTDQELSSAYYYVGTYLQNNKPLLSATKMNSDGTWDNTNPGNPDLYNKIVAIHNKYGIF